MKGKNGNGERGRSSGRWAAGRPVLFPRSCRARVLRWFVPQVRVHGQLQPHSVRRMYSALLSDPRYSTRSRSTLYDYTYIRAAGTGRHPQKLERVER